MRRLVLAALAGVLVAGGCGGGTGTDGFTTAAVSESSAATADGAGGADSSASSILPSVETIDVVSGETFDLARLPELASGRPIVLWFWAPH